MSLGIAIKGPEGLVLAAESRVTLTAETAGGDRLHVNFDNATKLLSFSEHTYVGAVTYGQAAIDLRTAFSFVPEFEAKLPRDRLGVEEFAGRLSSFFRDQWHNAIPGDYNGPDMTFLVGGFDQDDPYGRVFFFEIPNNPDPVERNPHPEFGMTWGGQQEFVHRLIHGYARELPALIENALGLQPEQHQALREALTRLSMPIPLQAMPLQDCVDLAIFFIRTTINAQNLTVGIRGVGGPIDVAIITRDGGLQFVQRKQIVGERGTGRQVFMKRMLEDR
jgi:hypothetical protein